MKCWISFLSSLLSSAGTEVFGLGKVKLINSMPYRVSNNSKSYIVDMIPNVIFLEAL